MKNKEKYKNELKTNCVCDYNQPWIKDICNGKSCKGCALRFAEWCEQEAPLDITGLEEEVLKKIRRQFKYIARDKDGKLFVYYNKPQKSTKNWISRFPYTQLPIFGVFDWITFDDDEPVCIDDYVER